MDLLNFVLPVLLYLVCIILVVVLIILGIKVIMMIDKVNKLVDDVSDKVNSLNGVFRIIDKATDGFSNIVETVVASITGFIYKIFKGHNKKNKDIEEDLTDE